MSENHRAKIFLFWIAIYSAMIEQAADDETWCWKEKH